MRKFKFGVDTFIWSEEFSEDDLWVIRKADELGFASIDFAIAHPSHFPTERVVEELAKTGLTPITTTTLGLDTNPISPDSDVRAAAVRHMKLMVDVSKAIGAKVTGGVNYAGWGYLTRKMKTRQEWEWSVSCMRQVAEYALMTYPELKICVEPCNRFETHFINTALEGVEYCKAVDMPNMGVHLDCFHMSHEENNFVDPVRLCGKKYLGYVHVNENQRGIPGTGMVDFHAFFNALEDIDYDGYCVIESFDPNFEELAGNCAIWRRFAPTGEELAVKGLANLRRIADEVDSRREPSPGLQLAE
jgi:D-psicose/D-tagatose/L-ribulose 3-epimerase